jgi:hypothetical protein
VISQETSASKRSSLIAKFFFRQTAELLASLSELSVSIIFPYPLCMLCLLQHIILDTSCRKTCRTVFCILSAMQPEMFDTRKRLDTRKAMSNSAVMCQSRHGNSTHCHNRMLLPHQILTLQIYRPLPKPSILRPHHFSTGGGHTGVA